MKKLFLILFSILTLGLFSGCGETKESTPAKKNEIQKISIQIDGAAAEIVKNVATGNVQFGFPNADSVILAKSQGIPVKVVNTTYQHGLGALIFQKSSGITEPKDLKDKKIGVTSFGSPNYIQLQVMLEKAGMSIDDVKVEIIGTGAIVNALVSGQVDAIMFSMLRTIELKNQGVDVGEIRSDEFLPSHGNVLIVGDKYLTENKDVVNKFNIALNKGIQYIIDGNTKEAVEMSVEKYAPSFKGREEIVTAILDEVFIPYLWQSENTKKNGLGYSDAERWSNSIKVLKEYGVIEKEIDAKELIGNIK